MENGRFLVPTFCKKSRSKFVWLGRTCELCNQGRITMPIVGGHKMHIFTVNIPIFHSGYRR
jgi:hypothetical protein